jgi:hypothetical protein
MTAAEFYEASALNRRHRSTQAEMEVRGAFLLDYAEEHRPVTVRQLFYRASVEGLVDKTEKGYAQVQRQVLQLRREGLMPYGDIADLSRRARKPYTCDSVAAALEDTAQFYRKALWRDNCDYVEVWCEKDALAGVIEPVTRKFDVPLMVTRGFASETFCFEAVNARIGDPREYVVYYLGDCDRSGVDAANALEEKLDRFGAEMGRAFINFQRLAISPEDILEFDGDQALFCMPVGEYDKWLPTREPKRESAADRNWPHPWAIELDAIEPDDLRAMVQWAIEQHLPPEQYEILKVAEESERKLIQGLVASAAKDGGI